MSHRIAIPKSRLLLLSGVLWIICAQNSAFASQSATSRPATDKIADTTRKSARDHFDRPCDLMSLSLEELMNVEVTVAAKAE